ncbi:hypothetical protein AC579_7190 [Pseudocercospora musae]|uniref:Ribosome biogenesis protein SLX9 n=1 Tax=Pseudocercospora musae TaxID=113226 RepID=A0A139I446_9PEZI|nr:hypothetical protein AC579_7190 [Pseudocercospora musae]
MQLAYILEPFRYIVRFESPLSDLCTIASARMKGKNAIVSPSPSGARPSASPSKRRKQEWDTTADSSAVSKILKAATRDLDNNLITAFAASAPATQCTSTLNISQPPQGQNRKTQKRALVDRILAAKKHLISPPSQVVEQS